MLERAFAGLILVGVVKCLSCDRFIATSAQSELSPIHHQVSLENEHNSARTRRRYGVFHLFQCCVCLFHLIGKSIVLMGPHVGGGGGGGGIMVAVALEIHCMTSAVYK